MIDGEAVYTFAVNTADATQTNITDLPISSSKSFMVWVEAYAVKENSNESAYFQLRGMFFTDSNGNISQLYGQRLVQEQETIKTQAALNWDIKLDISQANTMTFNVKGAANSNISWRVTVRFVEHAYVAV